MPLTLYVWLIFIFVLSVINTYSIFDSFFDLYLSVLYFFSAIISQLAILLIFCIAALFFQLIFMPFLLQRLPEPIPNIYL